MAEREAEDEIHVVLAIFPKPTHFVRWESAIERKDSTVRPRLISSIFRDYAILGFFHLMSALTVLKGPETMARWISESWAISSMLRRLRPDRGFGNLRGCASVMAVVAGANARDMLKCAIGDGEIVRAELHWYEATGIGKRQFKIKRFL